MTRIARIAAATLPALLATAPAFAQSATCVRYGWSGWWYTCVEWSSSGGTTSSGVPEIDAGAGLLAVAAVAAVVLFVRERRRRAA